MKTLGKVIYIGVLPAMGTTLLLLALFMQEISMVTTNETFLKVFGLMMCATTWFAAFQYWNSFVREFTIQMTEPEIDEYQEYAEGYYEGYNEPEEAEFLDRKKVELNSPDKGICRPFTVEHPSLWMKNSRDSWGNGYVIISSEHPWSGRDADHIEHSSLQEITFSGTFSQEGLKDAGFEKEIYENADQYWVFGFDTLHSYNSSINDENWVREQAIELADALQKEVIKEVI
tara:strand:- start:759 stop:1448 length:690 start_codon:yes stop_codon:yes gene_type:complete